MTQIRRNRDRHQREVYWVPGIGWCGPDWRLMDPEADEVPHTQPRTLAEQWATEDDARHDDERSGS